MELVQEEANLCGLHNNSSFELQGADLDGAKLQGASLSYAELQGTYLTDAELQGAHLTGAKLQGADLTNAELQGANLTKAELQGANLSGAWFQGADLFEAKLQGADLTEAWFQGANLTRVLLHEADLWETNLIGADLTEAELQGATLRNVSFGCLTSVQEAKELKCTNISNAVFSGPKCSIDEDTYEVTCDENKLVFVDFKGVTGIETLVYNYSDHLYFPVTLLSLRKHLRDSGYELEARAITYVIQHGLIEEAWYFDKNEEVVEGKERETFATITASDGRKYFDYEEDVTGITIKDPVAIFGAYLRYYAFDWTVMFGLKPSGAIIKLGYVLLISMATYLVMLWLKFIFPYWSLGSIQKITLKNTHATDGISKTFVEGEYVIENLLKPIPDYMQGWSHYRFWLYLLGHVIWFAILASFHFGWRDLNVGNWLSRMQPKTFTYKSTGLFRTLSGIQSLVSVYLLALFVLTFFGHPWG